MQPRLVRVDTFVPTRMVPRSSAGTESAGTDPFPWQSHTAARNRTAAGMARTAESGEPSADRHVPAGALPGTHVQQGKADAGGEEPALRADLDDAAGVPPLGRQQVSQLLDDLATLQRAGPVDRRRAME